MEQDLHDPQVAREKKALKDVRALLDEIEEEEKYRFRGMGLQFLVVVTLIAAAVFGYQIYRKMTVPPTPKPTVEMTAPEYQDHVVARIEFTRVKYRSRVQGVPGTTGVTIRIDANGKAELKTSKPSGDRNLDDNVLSLVAQVGSFGPPPAAALAGTDHVEMTRFFTLDADRKLFIAR
ncbi:MAG: energy transducer TonB [Usitatibacter sp.]